MSVDPVSIAVQVALVAANMALTASQSFEGPRLSDLTVTTADYGAALNYVYGTRRLDGVSCLWCEPLTEVKQENKTKGGKYNQYTYYGTWAVAVVDHQIDAVTRIWFDRNLVYDASGAGPLSPFAELGDITQYMRFYLGTADQEQDPRMAATLGAENTPAYRGVAYIVFQDLPLEKLGNRLPQVSVEVVTNGGAAYPLELHDRGGAEVGTNLLGFTYSPDRSRVLFCETGTYEIWDVAARALMIAGDLDESLGDLTAQDHLAITNDGTIYACGAYATYSAALYRYSPDGTGAQTFVGEWANAQEPFALQDGNGAEWIGVASFSTYHDGALYNVEAQQFTVLDTSANTGASWQVKSFLTDLDGNIWALGANASSSTLAMWQLQTGVFHFVPMPSSASLIVAVSGYHYRDATVDHFVIAWADDYLVTVDAGSFTVTQSRAYSLPFFNTKWAFRNAAPGAASVWLGGDQISAVDLSTVRLVDLHDWGLGFGLSTSQVYDPLNHAMLIGVSGFQVGWAYLDRLAGEGVTLQSIVEDVALRSGLTADDIDASDLTQTVKGYSWTQGGGKAILEPLLEAYDSEARPHDFQIEFRRRGAALGGAIAVGEMGAGGGNRYEIPTTLDSDLPLKVNLTFADLDKDQQPNTAIAQRAGAATDSKRELSLDASTLAMTADDARPMAEGYLRRAWIKAQTAKLGLTRAYSSLEPGDALTLELDDVSRGYKLTKLEFGANGVLTSEWERYAASIHAASGLAGAPADGMTPGEVPTFGYTKGLFLDIPLARDSDEGLIGYLAAAPYSTGVAWPGATFYRSDDGTSYSADLGDVASSQAATVGYALSALPDAMSTVWDTASVVTVKLNAGTLLSATRAEVANGANRALLGDEIIGFTTATLVAADTYQLSGLHRGRRGTEWATATHLTGDRFVLLSALPRAALGASDVGDSFYVKPITSGGSSGFPQSVDPFTGASLRPYAPCHLAAADDGADITFTWTRRTRLGGTWRDIQDVPLGEGSEAYKVQVLDGSGAVLRTVTGISSPSWVYTAALRAADTGEATLRVMQVSATVGDGFAADLAL